MFKLAQAVKQSYYQEMDDKDSKIARRKTIYRWLDKRKLSKDASEDAKEGTVAKRKSGIKNRRKIP